MSEIDRILNEIKKADQLLELGRFKEAKKCVVNILQYDPNEPYAFQILAYCEACLGNYAASEKAANECLRLDPENDFAYFTLSVIALNRNELNQAENTIQQALAISPDNPDFLLQFAKIKVAKDDKKNALSIVKKGLQINPNHIGLLELKAIYHFDRFEEIEGVESLIEALKQEPNNGELLTKFGYVQLYQKNYEGAAATFQQALNADPSIEDARQGLAETYKVKWKVFRIFHQYGFSRWRIEWSLWKVVLFILLLKTFAIWGAFFGLFLLFTWWGDVFFNSVLRLGKRSKFLLAKRKITQSNYFIIANSLAISSGFSALVIESELLWKCTAVIVLLVFIGIAFFEVKKKARTPIVAIAVFMCFILFLAKSLIMPPFLLLTTFLLLLFGLLFSFRIIG